MTEQKRPIESGKATSTDVREESDQYGKKDPMKGYNEPWHNESTWHTPEEKPTTDATSPTGTNS
jgi:hypothetical protein